MTNTEPPSRCCQISFVVRTFRSAHTAGLTSLRQGYGGPPKLQRRRKACTSDLSSLNEDQIAERGARLAKRDDRGYREYLREKQRRQARGPQRASRVGVEEGCPAREVVLDQRGQATRGDAPSVERRCGTVRRGACMTRSSL